MANRRLVPLMFAITFSVSHVADAQVEWSGAFRLQPEAQVQILRLAEQARLGPVARVRQHPRSSCPYHLIVETARVLNGRRRSWSDVHVSPAPGSMPVVSPDGVPTQPLEGASGCGFPGFERDPRFIVSPINQREDWLIEDREWRMFVRIREAIPYSTVRTVILAFHRRQVRDERLDRMGELPLGNGAASIRAVARGREPLQWRVVMSPALSYVVRERRGRFEAIAQEFVYWD